MEPSRHPIDQLGMTLDSQSLPSLAAPDRVAISVAEPMLAMLGTSRSSIQLRNTTVLPKVDGCGDDVALSPRSETRYQHLRRLGAGAMGEVSLVQDNDIGRTVAMKQLLVTTQSPAGVARFVEEIRTIGQLEHPNIVPIHDVGIDENGRLFFVMKHIDGETLESILSKLDVGDPEYLARYTIDVRIEIFVGLLRALQYAHEKGVVHRDIKPANVMVGRFGEVVLMDWGIAKLAEKAGAGAKPEHETPRGELVGTPAYMSPEQASGEVRDIDARSDLYGATVLFHELLAVKHYLAHCKELRHLLMSVLAEEFSYLRLAFLRHPGHPVPAAELLHFIVRGLQKDPGERYQNAAEMIGELQHIRDGHCRVSCPATLAKRMSNGVGHFVSHYPKLSPFVFYSVLLFVICYMTMTTYLLLARVG